VCQKDFLEFCDYCGGGAVKFLIYLFAISGVASTKEKSFERLTNFIVERFFVKKRPLRGERRGPTRKETYMAPP
jgi:hypothetical protein